MNKQQLINNIKAKKSFLCVGLDTDLKKVPQTTMSISSTTLSVPSRTGCEDLLPGVYPV